MSESPTLETLVARMEYLATQNKGDLNGNHIEADDLLIEALQFTVRFGHMGSMQEAYAAIDKWYA